MMPADCTLQVTSCTDAGVAPPDDWASGFHALTLGPLTVGILRLLALMVQSMPHMLAAQVHHISQPVHALGFPGTLRA